MEDRAEKRSCERHYQEAQITVAYFNTSRHYLATMLNYSEEGLYFESDFAFKSGTSIFIRLEKRLTDLSEDKIHYGFRSATLGKVKWCREVHNGESFRYGTGIRYYELPY